MGKSLGRSQYFIKLLVFSLIIGAIPLVVQGYLSYQMTSQVVLKKIMESHTLRNMGTQMEVEKLLNSIQSNILQFSSSTEVLKALQSDLTWNNYEIISDLLNNISRLQVVKSGVPSVAIFDLKHSWVVNDGLFRYSEYPSIGFLDTYFKRIGKSKWATGTDIFGEKGGQSDPDLYYVQRVPTFSLMLEGMIVTKLPITEISRLITVDSPDKGDFFILDESGRIIAGTHGLLSGQTVEKTNWFKKMNEDRGYLFTEYEGNRVGIFYQKSSQNGWIYVTAIPLNVIQKDLENVQWKAIITCACLLAGVLLLSFIGTRNIYSPIAKLNRLFHIPSATVTPNEKKDEFNLIVQQFQQLLQERTVLQHQLHRQYNQLKDYFIQRLLRGEIELAEGMEKLPIFEMPVAWNALAVFTVQIDSLHHTRFTDNDRDLLMFAINNLVNELIPRNKKLGTSLIDRYQVTVICFQNEQQHEMDNQIYDLAAEIQQKVDQYFGLKVSIGISRRYICLSDTSKAYLEAKEVLKNRIQRDHEAILYVKDVSPRVENARLMFPHALESKLLENLWIGTIEETRQLLTAIFKHIASAYTNYREYEYMITRFLVNILKSAEDMNVPLKEIFTKKSLFDELLEQKTPDDVENWLLSQVIVPLKDLFQSCRRPERDKIAEEIVRMVEEGHEINLTLDICASRLGFSPNTVKRVMKAEMGMNFSEYLSVVRLETAKKWLKMTEMNISTIAEKLHYNNSQNFIRYFRKVVGMTPGQYRDSNHQK